MYCKYLFRSCKNLFGPEHFPTVQDRMSCTTKDEFPLSVTLKLSAGHNHFMFIAYLIQKQNTISMCDCLCWLISVNLIVLHINMYFVISILTFS